ncbi:MAG: DUF1259 domain-containing protein [Gemmatimonadales bacterium]|jgi:hypothetical protein
MIRKSSRCVLALVVFALALPASAPAQRMESQSAWDSVGRVLQTAPAPSTGYVRFNFPRRDIVLKVRDVTVAPALALGAWFGFSGTPAASLVMGDLVLLGDELGPALDELNKQGIGVTAIHNHVVGEPQVTFVHVHAEGPAVDLARKLDRVLARTRTPRPVAAATPAPVTIDTALVNRTLGAQGRAAGAVSQFSMVLPTVPITMHGKTVVPGQAYATPVNVQMVDASRYVATGDFSVLEGRVQPVLSALASHGITATALHSHMIGETPKIYYIHFWADGAPAAVLAGLRAAIDAGR